MNEKVIVPDIDKNAERCLCPDCPTHNECMKSNKEKFFCSLGNTECDIEKHGCLCGSCPVWDEYGLDAWYYCEIGPAQK
jgi:hypothetical protein